jgi:hypothetical protein
MRSCSRSKTPRRPGLTVRLLLTALLGLGTSSAVLADTFCSDNYVWFHFFDENGNPLPVSADGINVQDWAHTANHGCGDTPEPKQNSDHTIGLKYTVKRHKSSDMGDTFRELITPYGSDEPNPNFGLGLGDDVDQTQNNASPDELNFVIAFDLHGIDIGDGRILTIPYIVTAQGSKTSGILAFLNLTVDIGETVFDLYDEDLEGALKSFKDTVKDTLNLEFENNWYLSQPAASTDPGKDPHVVFLTTYHGDEALVIRAFDQNGNAYPMVIRSHGTDYDFTVNVLTTQSADKVAGEQLVQLSDSYYLGDAHYLDETIGIFRREADTEWLYSLQLGWLYPFTGMDSGPNLWFFVDSTQSWIWTSADYPGYSYWELTDSVYFFNRETFRFERVPDDE